MLAWSDSPAWAQLDNTVPGLWIIGPDWHGPILLSCEPSHEIIGLDHTCSIAEKLKYMQALHINGLSCYPIAWTCRVSQLRPKFFKKCGLIGPFGCKFGSFLFCI